MDCGKRIDVFVAERYGITRSAAQRLIDDGSVTVNGDIVKKNRIVSEADEISVVLPEPEPDSAEPQDIPLDIVYEDGYLLVVNKPKGMVVHPAAGNRDGTLVNALLYHCGGSLSGINGVIRPGIVHRIDKDTSGLLVVAKTNDAHLSLASQIASHTLERRYEAISVGHLKNTCGIIDKPIGRSPADRKKMAVVENGRNAVTHYEVTDSFASGFDRVSLMLETGRTHQIRVHMSSIGHPLLGDTLYGGGRTPFEKKYSSVLNGQCLHAKTLTIIHPVTGEKMRFDSELPEYFKSILGLIAEYE